jgi:hypothetical protein
MQRSTTLAAGLRNKEEKLRPVSRTSLGTPGGI